MKIFISLALTCITLAAQADPFTPRSTDVALERSEMNAIVIGATHEFFDGGKSFFSISGSYSYTYTSGQIAYGTWSYPADGAPGVICTHFRIGFERCDMYVRSGERLVLLTHDGLRLPVRSNSAGG